MRKNVSCEKGVLVFEDYNYVIYTRTNGKKICWHGKSKNLNNYNVNPYFCKICQNYNFSVVNNNLSLRLYMENKLFKKVQKNVKQLIKYIIRLRNKVRNIYLFIKFISSKCILKMSTFYYLKFIIEKIYERKLDKIVRVVLPIADLHKLYSYIYYENFSFTNYYKDVLSKYGRGQLRRYYCSFIILNNKKKNLTQSYEKIYGLGLIKMNSTNGMNCENDVKKKKQKIEIPEKGEMIHNAPNASNTPNSDILAKPDNAQNAEDNNKTEAENITSPKQKISLIKEINKKESNFYINRERNLKGIKVEKYKIKRTISKNLHKSDIGLFAGTFDKIHFGHMLLLFYSIFLTKKFFYIGLYNNKNIYNKKYSEEIDDLKLRIFHISDILFLIKNVYHIHFFFHNFEHIMPFIKIKNSHKILYEIITSQKTQTSMEYNKSKYQKFVNLYYFNKKKKKKKRNGKNKKEKEKNYTIPTYNNLKKKYLFLLKSKIDKIYQGKFCRKKTQLLIADEMKRKISKYLNFHLNSKKKSNRREQKKIIVFKRIHDPFSFAVDIKDLYCLTMSKESEANGYSVVNRRKLLFKKVKTDGDKTTSNEINQMKDNNNNNNSNN
ncbi:hypothetical protein PMALA_000180, partial [Plasmodium malariae]